ncbi:MAG: type I glyceraldehyde-3-phosphate dehydrogenase [Anaerolineae bacterium]|jgi:glyceraldehyde 3-phosphate dehydrogenase
MKKVAINGFGRIGRAAFKILLDTPDLELVAVNDIAPLDNLAYLLQYDTAYGRYDKSVEVKDGNLLVDGQEYQFYAERDPAQLPWAELGVDIVFECTGFFADEQGLNKHLEAGAEFAILSAPAKGGEVPTVVHGVNTPDGQTRMVSCASCTTNCITPVVEVMSRRIGVEKAIMTTIHAYTTSQAIVDAPSKKVRRGRAGAANFVPTSTGAAIATTKVLPALEGSFDGVAVRGPIVVGSIADLVFVTSRDTSVAEINRIFREEAESEQYAGILAATDEPIVSSDIVGDSHASIVDLEMTQVVGGNLVKVMSWYDNEWGFTSQMVREGQRIAATLE